MGLARLPAWSPAAVKPLAPPGPSAMPLRPAAPAPPAAEFPLSVQLVTLRMPLLQTPPPVPEPPAPPAPPASLGKLSNGSAPLPPRPPALELPLTAQLTSVNKLLL